VNPNQCRVVLRPRDPLEVFDLAWRLLAARPWPFLRLTLVLFAAPWLAASGLAWALGWHWGVGLGFLAAAPLLRVPLTALAGRLLFADEVRTRDVLVDVAGRVPALLGGLGVALLAGAGVALTCGLAAPVAAVSLAFLPEALLLERVPVWRAVRRASRLAAVGGLQSLAAAVATVFLTAWLVGLGEATGQAVVGFLFQLGAPAGRLWALQTTPFALAGVVLAQPLLAAYRLLLYVDVRTRTEGWDLQVGLRALGLSS
jgi:hypothetical protein